jgi:hypothetical protein
VVPLELMQQTFNSNFFGPKVGTRATNAIIQISLVLKLVM